MSRIFYDLAAMAVHESKRVSSSHAAPELQRRALALIDTHLADPDLRSASMASELGTSVRTVQNLFAELGKTPTAAILERRLERAADRLIADPQATITTLPSRTGSTTAPTSPAASGRNSACRRASGVAATVAAEDAR